MIAVGLCPGADLDGFRRALCELIATGTPPAAVVWHDGDAPSLFGGGEMAGVTPLSLPRAAARLIETVICHRDPERYALLHALVWRLHHGERALLEIASDPLVYRLGRMEKSVHRDLHKMHAYIRFRRVGTADGERFIAWFEPGHFILEATADFFVDRFRGMAWSILTPDGSLHWDGAELALGPPARREQAPACDALEASWRSYYESTFNPARLNPRLMQSHMAKKYWRNLPEASSIPALVRSAPSRVSEMIEREVTMSAKRNPARAVAAMADQEPKFLADLNRIICAAPPMVEGGTRAVLGEGPRHAAIALVGEQPGDEEDKAGRPFVGPAGRLLDKALAEAGIDRESVYVTNAVKHFKFEQRGKRRIHSKPNAGEVKHYRWWLEKELKLVKPRLTVALGATAVLALTGKALPVMKNRGPAQFDGHPGYITVHPSFLLRLRDPADRQQAFADFVDDLKRARRLAQARKVAA
jgi:probable DNA metabolism protein